MTDLRVDTDALRRSERAYADMAATLAAATAGMDRIGGGAVAQADLRVRLDELADAWGVGLRTLGEHASEAASALAGVADAFDSLDGDLASSLEQSGPESRDEVR
jgi:hypothetical protein